VDIFPGEYGMDVVVEISGADVEEIRRIDLETSPKVLGDMREEGH